MNVCKVRSTAERGHWRSGRHWGPQFVLVSANEVTPAMFADPRLVIELVEEAVQAVVDEVTEEAKVKKTGKAKVKQTRKAGKK